MKIALDANLLILLVVGLVDRSLVGKHKRTRAFNPPDYDLLLEILQGAEQIIVTPHILTEASNLLGQDDDPRCRTLRGKLAELIDLHEERYVPAVSIAKHSDFLRLGIADCGILSIVDTDTVVLTTDLALYLTAMRDNPSSLNFTHIRLANGLLTE